MDKPPAYEKFDSPQQIPLEAPSPHAPYPSNPAFQQPPVITPSITNVTVTTNPVGGGTCPVCHAGVFKSGFTCCGILCCILLFPIGIICCLCMRKKKCNHCGFSCN